MSASRLTGRVQAVGDKGRGAKLLFPGVGALVRAARRPVRAEAVAHVPDLKYRPDFPHDWESIHDLSSGLRAAPITLDWHPLVVDGEDGKLLLDVTDDRKKTYHENNKRKLENRVTRSPLMSLPPNTSLDVPRGVIEKYIGIEGANTTEEQLLVEDVKNLRAYLPKVLRGVIERYIAIEGANRTEEQLLVEDVIENLRADLPKVLREELRWDNFADDLKVIDQTGAALEGKVPIKFLLKLLRRASRRRLKENSFEANVDVYFGGQDPFLDIVDDILRAVRWKIALGREKRPGWQILRKDEGVVVEIETVFHFNERLQVDWVRIDGFLINSQSFPIQLKLWPDLKKSDSLRSELRKVKQWYEGNRKLIPLKLDTKETLQAIAPTRREFLTGLAIQTGVLVVGKGEIERAKKFGRSKDAIESLADTIPDILVQEPDWEYFADDFTLVDQLGVSLKGLGPNKKLLKLLRNLRDYLLLTPLRANFEAEIEKPIVEFPDGSEQRVVIADWTLTIDLVSRIPYNIVSTLESQALTKLRISTFPFLVMGTSCFQFDEEGRVKVMKIDRWAINGKKVELPLTQFPFRNALFGDAASNLNVKNIEKQMDERPAAIEQLTDAIEAAQRGDAEPDETEQLADAARDN